MQLYRWKVPRDKFARLPNSEKLFVLRVSQIHNDLHHIHHLVSTADNGLEKLSGVERQIALHQFLFAVKLWCGTLTEARQLINSAWQGSNLHKKFNAALEAEAKAALSKFRKYFSKRNSIEQVRNKLAFHYDANAIAAQLQRVTLDDGYEFLGGERRGNIFYSSAENFRMLAFLDVAALGNASTGFGELFDEMNAIHQQFMTFSEAVLVAIVKQCGLTREQITSTSIVDPKTVEPIIFVDEDAIARWVEKTHERVVGGQKQSKGPPGR
jgi:hypothetical protein